LIRITDSIKGGKMKVRKNLFAVVLLVSFVTLLTGSECTEKQKLETSSTPKFVEFDKAPTILKQMNPVYPEKERKNKVEGIIQLKVEVLETGKIGAIEVKKSLSERKGGLEEAAINALRQWEFQPAEKDGKKIAAWIIVPVEFKLH
jgi:TonB family protein